MTHDQLGRAVELAVAGPGGAARDALNGMIEAGLLDDLMDRVETGGLALTGEGGLLAELVKAVLKRGLAAELPGHLGGSTLSGPRCGSSPTPTARTSPPRSNRSTPRRPSRPPRASCSSSPSPTSANGVRPRWRPGRTRGNGSSRFWPSRPNQGRSSTRPTRSGPLNYQLRKVIKNRWHFPSDDAAIMLLWLAIRDIEDKRARARAKEIGLPAGQRRAQGRLVEASPSKAGNKHSRSPHPST